MEPWCQQGDRSEFTEQNSTRFFSILHSQQDNQETKSQASIWRKAYIGKTMEGGLD